MFPANDKILSKFNFREDRKIHRQIQFLKTRRRNIQYQYGEVMKLYSIKSMKNLEGMQEMYNCKKQHDGNYW
jgi:hypothetical protein